MSARSIGEVALGYLERRNDPVHRHSYDVEDPRAKVFRRIGDGTKAQGFAYTGALRETLKQLIRQHKTEKYKGDDRLQWTDYTVYDAILSCLDFASGALFPEHKTIAHKAAVCKQVVIDSIKRLNAHGFIEWVRRSIRADSDEGPKRKQTSNAYFFDLRGRMASRVWHYFQKALSRNLGRLGGAARAGQATRPPPKVTNLALERSLAALGRHFEPDPSPSP
jgi:hypothetical protein